ncbi:fatty acid-binding protein [Dermatophagoides farinae]|uniref:Fatty acid-binding protein n=1 Tax=Dermatophagoides farinae TaxID=6954 RepID=A0A922I8M2_DERFA|nr:fatty acid-binding protein-like [Dermatophagoides farinae]KAH7641228.1 fatty acid-binding protein-like [Dermatophagoides farinae]KAH9526969.1 calycin super [Dermatophagoides farinae]
MVQIEGKYKLEKSEKFDEFLSELGVNFVKRNLAKRVTPVVTITKDGDYYVFKTETTVKNTEIKFKLNEEFEEMRADDVLVKTIITMEGDNRMIQIQKGDKEVKIVREFTDDGLNVIATVNGVTSVRFYKRL